MAPRVGKSKKSPTITNPDGKSYKEYTTARGVVIRVTAAPPLMAPGLNSALEQQWESEGRALPTVPTYEIKTAAGTVEVHAHDEKTIKGNPEAESAWAEYNAGKAQFEKESREAFIRSMILDCVEFDESPGWMAKAKARKVRVPDDEYARKLYFAYTEVFGSPDDYSNVMLISAELSGATESQITAIRAAFRSPLGKSNGANPGRVEASTKAG